MRTCPRCSLQFNPLEGAYAPDGSIVCVPCGHFYKTQSKETLEANKASAFVGSIGGLVLAFVSFGLDLRFLPFALPLVATAIGGGTAYTALRSEAAQSLGWKRIPTVIIGGTAVLVGLLSFFSRFGAE